MNATRVCVKSLAVLVVLLCVATAVQATVLDMSLRNSNSSYGATSASSEISLVNPGFEQPAVGKISNGFDDSSKDVPGWVNESTETYTDSGVDNGQSHSGSYAGYLYGGDPGGVYQVTNHVIASNENFTATCWVYRDGARGATNVNLFYVANDGTRETLATTTCLPTNLTTWEQYTVDASATDESLGHYIGVSFNGAQSYPSIDDVALSFTTTSVPEPASVVMLVTGLLGLLAYAWRKRK
jgi:hypothetical protein